MKNIQQLEGKTIAHLNARVITPEETADVSGGMPNRSCCSAGTCSSGGGYDDSCYTD